MVLDFAFRCSSSRRTLANHYSGQPGYISHTHYEFGSILKFIEDVWDLGRLGTTDKRAKSIGDCFDFTQAPRKFGVIPAKYSTTSCINHRRTNRSTPNRNHAGLPITPQ